MVIAPFRRGGVLGSFAATPRLARRARSRYRRCCRVRGGEFNGVEVASFKAAAMLAALPPVGPIDQNPTHDFGGYGIELVSILPNGNPAVVTVAARPCAQAFFGQFCPAISREARLRPGLDTNFTNLHEFVSTQFRRGTGGSYSGCLTQTTQAARTPTSQKPALSVRVACG